MLTVPPGVQDGGGSTFSLVVLAVWVQENLLPNPHPMVLAAVVVEVLLHLPQGHSVVVRAVAGRAAVLRSAAVRKSVVRKAVVLGLGIHVDLRVVLRTVVSLALHTAGT